MTENIFPFVSSSLNSLSDEVLCFNLADRFFAHPTASSEKVKRIEEK